MITAIAQVIPQPLEVVVEGESALWDAPAVIALAIPLVVALLAIWAGNRQATADRREARRSELAERFGHALADALAWCEIPHRIARRTSDSADTLQALVDRVHDLQDRLLYHQQWIVMHDPTVGAAYADLVRDVKAAGREPIRAAWRQSPIETTEGQNRGDDVEQIDIDSSTERFTQASGEYLRAVGPTNPRTRWRR